MRAGREWGMMLGITSVTRELVTKQYIPLLSQIAMPSYLTQKHVLVTVLSHCLGTPVIQSFPMVLIIATSATSFIIVKVGHLRYWFGLPPPQNSLLPGQVIRGFLPLSVPAVAVIIVYCLQFIIYLS